MSEFILKNPGAEAAPLVRLVWQREVAPGHFRAQFHSEAIARGARAGQFVHVLPRSNGVFDPLLRRAFSVLKTDGDEFEILYKVMGRGTEMMSHWQPGDLVSVLGPLGKPFPAIAPHSILVGGGVGVPPLAMLASERSGQKMTALVGARTASDVLCGEDFQAAGVPCEVTTDDGSAGHHGFVTELLKVHLEKAGSEKPSVYSCGPLPMLRAVSRVCHEHGATCYVSLEEAMPCGVGVCNGCVVPIKPGEGSGGAGDDYSLYKRICVDGPVLSGQAVDWEKLPVAH